MLTSLLVRLLIRDGGHPERPEVRTRYGVFSGLVGVAVNLLLCAVKLAVALLAGSLAAAADAVNNLSDAGSAVITVVGFKMAEKPADNEHPFGHGRIEYVAGLVVAVIIVAVGLNFFKESAMRIWRPSPVHANWLAIGILAATLAVKGWLFYFYRQIGDRIESPVIRAAAFDSLSDLWTTGLVLVSLAASRYTDFPVDGCAGMAVAAFIVWGGIGVMRSTVNPLLGECPDRELVAELRRKLLACPEIRGVHDIMLHNYGPNRYFASAHAEVNRNDDPIRLHDALEAAEVEIGRTMPIRLVLHCDPFDVSDPVVKLWRSRVEEIAGAVDERLKVYDFRLEPEEGCRMSFHLLIPREFDGRQSALRQHFEERLRRFDAGARAEIQFVHAFV